MKTSRSIIRSTLGKAAILAAVSLFAAIAPARATLLSTGVDLGSAGRTKEWAIFALSGGTTIADTTGVSFAAPTVRGDIGVYSNSITLSGTTKVDGTAYVNTGGSLRKSGTAAINGNGGLALQGGASDALVTSARNDALAATAQANALADLAEPSVTRVGWSSITTVNQNTSLSLSDTTAGAHVVLHLTDFVLSGGATFTLSGTAASTFVINVANKFSLLGGSVMLAGGVLPENVLFNVVGSGLDASLSSGAIFNGILLAPSRTVNLTGGSVANSTIIAGKVNISGGSKVLKPTYISP